MAKLAAMRYKSYVWPHNPRVYTIDFQREVAVQKFPMGRYRLQDLGLGHRVMKGEGEFKGEGAYDEFKKLACVFYDGGSGPLIHPIWQASDAYFVELSLAQEPRPDYVRYTFTFWEEAGETPGLKEISAAQGETASQTASQTGSQMGSQTGSGSGTQGGSIVQVQSQSKSAASTAVWHTVKKGETLWGISKKYGVALVEVIALNPQIKNPNLIYPGEKVRVK